MLREADDFISSVDGQVDWRAGSFETSKLEKIDKTKGGRSKIPSAFKTDGKVPITWTGADGGENSERSRVPSAFEADGRVS